MRAVQDGHHDAAVKLIEAGANANICAVNGIHVLHFAAFLDNVRIIELLSQKHISLNPKDANGMSPLHIATLKGNTSAAEALLTGGAIADIQNNDGFAPLHLAVAYDNVEMAELLMKRGASIEIKVEGNIPKIFSKSPKMNELFEQRGSEALSEDLPRKEVEEKEVTHGSEHTEKPEYAGQERSTAQSVKTHAQLQRDMADLKEEYNMLLPAC